MRHISIIRDLLGKCATISQSAEWRCARSRMVRESPKTRLGVSCSDAQELSPAVGDAVKGPRYEISYVKKLFMEDVTCKLYRFFSNYNFKDTQISNTDRGDKTISEVRLQPVNITFSGTVVTWQVSADRK